MHAASHLVGLCRQQLCGGTFSGTCIAPGASKRGRGGMHVLHMHGGVGAYRAAKAHCGCCSPGRSLLHEQWQH